MKSLQPAFLNQIRLSQEQASSLRAIGEYKGKQDLYKHQTPEVLKSLKMVAMIESSESSNRLEGIEASRDRIQDIVLKDTKPRSRSEQEIAGYRDALSLIHESARHMAYTENIIKQIHSMVYRYLPSGGGRWKMTHNNIVEKDSDGNILRVRFETVPPVQTPQAVDDLVIQYKSAIEDPSYEPLVLIPLAILDFLCVHPFSDGNGRVARLLTLLLLYQSGHELGRYISLERIFEESKETYYETLNMSSQGWHQGEHDVFPWMTYFWGVLIRAYKEFEERVGTITSGKGKKTEQIIMAVKRRIKPFAISQIENDCPGISRDWIRMVLNKLRNEGKIELQGRGRAAKWVHKKG